MQPKECFTIEGLPQSNQLPGVDRHSRAAFALALHVSRGVGRRAHRGGRARLPVLASVEPEQDVGADARRTPAEPRSRAVGASGQCFILGEIISQSRVRNLPAAALSSRVFFAAGVCGLVESTPSILN